jgi:hypothetical protein
MKKINVYLLFVLMFITACDEIFEDDISNSKIEIISPIDNLVTTKTTLTFWWDELEDANSYLLQIVSPCFDTILTIPLDTNITTNKFEVTLNPGRYNWRVKAINSGTETEWFTRKLTIQDELDISDQEVSLKSPKEQDAFSNGKVTFQWAELPNATSYKIIIRSGTWTGDSIYESETEDNLLSWTLGEGKYVWGVVGINDISDSQPQRKTFFIDLTAPGTPTLQDPENGSTITATSTTMKWTHTTTDATTVHDSLYIAKDSTFTESIKEVEASTTSYSFISSSYTGKVYWKVKAIDKAGNKSSFSKIFHFTLQ